MKSILRDNRAGESARPTGPMTARRILRYDSVDSTQRLAAHEPLGTVVVAEEQTAGQGRHGHSWHSEAGTGLYCSIVLKPTPLLTLALGLAAVEAIAKVTGLTCDLRWPNDLMIGPKKLGGILVQLINGNAIAGIGINVRQTHFPEGLEATSLHLAGREACATELLDALLPCIDEMIQHPPETILRLFTQASSYAAGRRVTVDQPGGLITGTTAGLNPEGYLIVRQDDGTDTLILAGGVRAAAVS